MGGTGLIFLIAKHQMFPSSGCWGTGVGLGASCIPQHLQDLERCLRVTSWTTTLAVQGAKKHMLPSPQGGRDEGRLTMSFRQPNPPTLNTVLYTFPVLRASLVRNPNTKLAMCVRARTHVLANMPMRTALADSLVLRKSKIAVSLNSFPLAA